MKAQMLLIKDHATATAFLAKGRSQHDRPLPGKNTRLVRQESGDIAVRYVRTNIVVFKSYGDVHIDLGGWNTATTRDKIGSYSPIRIYTHNGQTFARFGDQHRPMLQTATLSASGWLRTDVADRDTSKNVLAAHTKLARRQAKLVNKYAKDLVAKILDDGDCACMPCSICRDFVPQPQFSWQSGRGAESETDGPERRMDPTHLWAHLHANELVSDLAQHACTYSAAGDWVCNELFNPRNSYYEGLVRKRAPRVVRRFLRLQLGLSV